MSGAASEQWSERRILIIEDEFLIAHEIAGIVAGLGAAVVGPARSQDEAIALLNSDAVHGAVLDIDLRGTEAFDVAEALLQRSVPFVFVTGYSPEVVPERYRHVPILEKPFNMSRLTRAVADQLLGPTA